MPALFAPSVSSTTTSGTYAPLTTGSGGVPGRPGRIARATFGSTSAIASIEARIPLPIAVRRPVVRLRIASTSACWSLVGGWITAARPLNATSPISDPELWLVTNATAAASAASSRVGSMSVEHMLPETSIARMIVAWLAGHAEHDHGPAERDHERRDARGEQREREVPPQARRAGPGRADQRQARVARGSRAPPALAPEVDGDQDRDEEDERKQADPQERHGSLPDHASDSAPPMTSSPQPERREQGRDLERLGPDDQLRLEVLVDRLDAVGVVGRVVRAAGHLGDLGQGRLVELGVDLEPVEVEVGARGAPDPDRHDPDPPVGGLLGHRDRVRALVVLAVAEQHDHGRRVARRIDRRQGLRRRLGTGCCRRRPACPPWPSRSRRAPTAGPARRTSPGQARAAGSRRGCPPGRWSARGRRCPRR